MIRIISILALASLVGCATESIDYRLSEKPYLTLSTSKTPAQYSNCMKAEWALYSTPTELDIPGGKRLLIAGFNVEYLVDVVEAGDKSKVSAYFRRTWDAGSKKRIRELTNCA